MDISAKNYRTFLTKLIFMLSDFTQCFAFV